MTDLVACLGTGKGTWTGVLKLVNNPCFEKVFLVVNSWTKDNLKINKPNISFVIINSDDKAIKIRDDIVNQLKSNLKGFEVAVNIDSGTGKEHAALITALMKLGLSLRIVECEGEKVSEISQNQEFLV